MPDLAASQSRASATVQSYVLLVDIVDFTDATGEQRVEWLHTLMDLIRDAAEEFEDLAVFPTGDGVILSMYANSPRPYELAPRVLNLARDVLQLNAQEEFLLRISINYGGTDALLDLPPGLAGPTSHVQVGTGISVAERLIHFAEPNEIVFSGQFWNQLRDAGAVRSYGLYPHRQVFVKYMHELELFSYKPTSAERDFIYHPKDADEQHFRKFAYFPPLKSETLDRFRELSLRSDLEQLCNYAYDTIAAVNNNLAYISWADVYSVLKTMPCVDGDEVLVLSRSDLTFDFWSTPQSKAYLKHLETTAARKCRRVPDRLFLYSSELNKPVVSPEVLNVLKGLHEPNRLNKLDVAYARDSLLSKYIFGVTIFPRLRCAVAPLPGVESYDDYLQTVGFDSVHDAFTRFAGTDFGSSSFRGYIIAKPELVAELIAAFEELKQCPLEPL